MTTPLNLAEIAICNGLFLIRFYPEKHHDAVLEDIASFVGPEKRGERLLWLIGGARRAMAAEGWRDELRGLWCTRFKPADGIEADCGLAGHAPANIEAEAIETHRQIVAAERRALPSGRPETLPGLQGLLSAARVKKLAPEENYSPPDWLKV